MGKGLADLIGFYVRHAAAGSALAGVLFSNVTPGWCEDITSLPSATEISFKAASCVPSQAVNLISHLFL